nr:MAG TPA: hypothetical protein [Caudoviricetes sp.]DAZ33693.1 MAG TPA: hypothetical protein [Caudoviricetes sp.]
MNLCRRRSFSIFNIKFIPFNIISSIIIVNKYYIW